jgi:hypothetical protein
MHAFKGDIDIAAPEALLERHGAAAPCVMLTATDKAAKGGRSAAPPALWRFMARFAPLDAA